MARLTREQIKAAISRQRPGFEVVEQSHVAGDAARERGAAPDAVSPDLQRAQTKYAGKVQDTRPDNSCGHPAGDADDDTADDDTTVLLKPVETPVDAPDAGPKIAILDAKGNIVAEQG